MIYELNDVFSRCWQEVVHLTGYRSVHNVDYADAVQGAASAV